MLTLDCIGNNLSFLKSVRTSPVAVTHNGAMRLAVLVYRTHWVSRDSAASVMTC